MGSCVTLLKRLHVVVLSVSCMAMAALGYGSPLEIADRFRIPFDQVEVQVSLAIVEQDQEKEAENYLVQLKGTQQSRVIMLNPDKRGQKVLLTDEGMWLHTPHSGRSIRITPLQRLMGQANYGDIGRMRWSGDYDIVASTPKSADRTLLQLQAKRSSAIYPRIDLVVNDASGCPLEAEYFLISGKMFKVAKFQPPETLLGMPVIKKIYFFDAMDIHKKTSMTVHQVKQVELDDALFSISGFTSP